MQKLKRQRRVVGDIVRIDIGDGWHTYARVLNEASFAFYDARVREELTLEQIIACPVLFQIPVMNHAVTKGRWPVVGHAPLDESLLIRKPCFMQDALNKDRFSIYENGKIRHAKRDECEGLEREAVWDPTHVEDRLRDHYAGRKNKWVESLKMRI